jgi:hypothetical protein
MEVIVRLERTVPGVIFTLAFSGPALVWARGQGSPPDRAAARGAHGRFEERAHSSGPDGARDEGPVPTRGPADGVYGDTGGGGGDEGLPSSAPEGMRDEGPMPTRGPDRAVSGAYGRGSRDESRDVEGRSRRRQRGSAIGISERSAKERTTSGAGILERLRVLTSRLTERN